MVRLSVATTGHSLTRTHPTPVHIDRPGPVRRHVVRDGADQRLAGEHDRFVRGL
jgi:hypothetical protein